MKYHLRFCNKTKMTIQHCRCSNLKANIHKVLPFYIFIQSHFHFICSQATWCILIFLQQNTLKIHVVQTAVFIYQSLHNIILFMFLSFNGMVKPVKFMVLLFMTVACNGTSPTKNHHQLFKFIYNQIQKSCLFSGLFWQLGHPIFKFC